jgi:uncharacterized protein (DUF2164 family)
MNESELEELVKEILIDWLGVMDGDWVGEYFYERGIEEKPEDVKAVHDRVVAELNEVKEKWGMK